MPFRTGPTIDRWVSQFLELGYDKRGLISVARHEPEGGENSGLVVVRLESINTSIYIQPAEVGSTEWVTTLEETDRPLEFTASELAALSAELIMVSALTAFLQAKSLEMTAENRGAGIDDHDDGEDWDDRS